MFSELPPESGQRPDEFKAPDFESKSKVILLVPVHESDRKEAQENQLAWTRLREELLEAGAHEEALQQYEGFIKLGFERIQESYDIDDPGMAPAVNLMLVAEYTEKAKELLKIRKRKQKTNAKLDRSKPLFQNADIEWWYKKIFE